MTQQITRADVWAVGEAYEPYVGRWSRLVAQEFISWLHVRNGREWLNRAILNMSHKLFCDPSEMALFSHSLPFDH